MCVRTSVSRTAVSPSKASSVSSCVKTRMWGVSGTPCSTWKGPRPSLRHRLRRTLPWPGRARGAARGGTVLAGLRTVKGPRMTSAARSSSVSTVLTTRTPPRRRKARRPPTLLGSVGGSTAGGPPTGWYAYLGVPVPDEEPPWEPGASYEEDAPGPRSAPPPAGRAAPVDGQGPPPPQCGEVPCVATERRVRPHIVSPLGDSDGSLWGEPGDDGLPPVVVEESPDPGAGPCVAGTDTPDARADRGALTGHVAMCSGSSGSGGHSAPGALDGAIVADDELPPTSARRVLYEALTPRMAFAMAAVERAFGEDWRERVMCTRRLSFADPVMFCHSRGRIAGERRYMHGLGGPCVPVYDRDRVVRWLTVSGRHPNNGRRSVAPPTPTPPPALALHPACWAGEVLGQHVRLCWRPCVRGLVRRSGDPGVLGPLCTLAHSRGLGTASLKTRPRTSVPARPAPLTTVDPWSREGGVLLAMRPPEPGKSLPTNSPQDLCSACPAPAAVEVRWGGRPRPDLGTSSSKTQPPSPCGGAAGEEEGRPACM